MNIFILFFFILIHKLRIKPTWAKYDSYSTIFFLEFLAFFFWFGLFVFDVENFYHFGDFFFIFVVLKIVFVRLSNFSFSFLGPQFAAPVRIIAKGKIPKTHK